MDFVFQCESIRTHPANSGRDFTVNGRIEEQALKNYLSRSVVVESLTARDDFTGWMNTLFAAGAKYLARSAGAWHPSAVEEARFEMYAQRIEAVHTVDPDMIFEFCIFECVSEEGVGGIAIPDWVFQAFGLPAEERNFDMHRMTFKDGAHVGDYGAKTCNPDITRTETQMFYYYRACRLIDVGFEGIHWGSMHITGERDKENGYADWTKVVNMVREYAKLHARRGFVLHNAHTVGIMGADGKLLFDFHCKPTRVYPPASASDHIPTESEPQEGVISLTPPLPLQNKYLFGRSLGGMTHSGWSCERLPYFLELDNWGGVHRQYQDTTEYPYWPWGYDEISWFVRQPLWYQQKWLVYAYQTIHELDSQAFFEMPGIRTAYLAEQDAVSTFYACPDLWDTIGEVWAAHHTSEHPEGSVEQIGGVE